MQIARCLRLSTAASKRFISIPTRSRFVTPPFVSAATSRGQSAQRAYHQGIMLTTPEAESTPACDESSKAKEELPPLSDRDFKIYNRLAEKMNYFHDHFRRTWNLLWNACTANRRPSSMTLKQFIDEGLLFAQQLTMHHSIEETYVFPMLAKKMPEFRGGRAELLQQHKQIHAGLDAFEAYLKQCRAREVDFEMEVLKGKMEGWGGVLWTHLDQEVETLGAENMRRYWTKEEIQRLAM